MGWDEFGKRTFEMSERSIFASLIREPDGSVSTRHGAFHLQSALQPVFRETPDGVLELKALEGLIRASRDGNASLPGDFFATVEDADRARIDSLCRSLHILNAGALRRRDTVLVVKINPELLADEHAIRHEIDRMRMVAREAGLTPECIACEIRKDARLDKEAIAGLTATLHEHGFLVAIDGYSGDDDDLDRLRLFRPDIVKFDSAWLNGFATNSAGLALLRVVIAQFHQDGIRPIVSGIEDPWQIDLCRDLGSPLMQGYLLARPEIAPTSFNLHFPEDDPSQLPPEPPSEVEPLFDAKLRRTPATFGKRGA